MSLVENSNYIVDMGWTQDEKNGTVICKNIGNFPNKEKLANIVFKDLSGLMKKVTEITSEALILKNSNPDKFNELVKNKEYIKTDFRSESLEGSIYWNPTTLQNVLKERTIVNVDKELKNLSTKKLQVYHYMMLAVVNSLQHDGAVFLPIVQSENIDPDLENKDRVSFNNKVCNSLFIKSLAWKSFSKIKWD